MVRNAGLALAGLVGVMALAVVGSSVFLNGRALGNLVTGRLGFTAGKVEVAARDWSRPPQSRGKTMA